MSTKTVGDKLLIKPNSTLWADPAARVDLIRPLPDGVRQVTTPAAAATRLVFAEDARSLRATLDAHCDGIRQPGNLWIAYPKANRADINRDSLWPILGDYGLRPISQVAVDDTWSALRFRTLAKGETFNGGRD